MKKLLLIVATSTAVLASAASFAEESFYIKGEAGALFMQKAKIGMPDPLDEILGDRIKLKSKTTGNFAIGAGYHVMDNARVDLTLGFLANPQFKKSGTIEGVTGSIKIKGKVMSLMVNGYVDLFDLGAAKVFAGAGIGWSQVKEKLVASVGSVSLTGKSKKANNFAYQLTIGTSAQLTDGVTAELSYRWSDFDKAKYKFDGQTESKIRYRGHNVIAGVRFNI